jgi:YHS domain-containing protein
MNQKAQLRSKAGPRRLEMETDPVCGMQVNPDKAAATTQYMGKTVYFCSKECKQKFDANPAAYADKV